jgi:hypothetical protein
VATGHPDTLIDQPPEPRSPVWKRLLRRARLLPHAWYRRLLLAHPRAFFLWAHLRSWLAFNRFKNCPSPDEIGAFWKEFPRAHCVRVARAIRSIQFRNLQAVTLAEEPSGLERLAALVRWRGAERLLDLRARKLPAILAGWHFQTPCFMGIAALHRLGIPALVMGFPPKVMPPGFEVSSPSRGDSGGDCAQRALVLRRVLAYLSDGGFVYTALDGPVGSGTAEFPFLGGRLTLRRGSAMLARLSGAPILPLTPNWDARGSGITVTVHDPLPYPACPPEAGTAFDNALLAEAACWTERYFRALPQELCLDLLEKHWRSAPGDALAPEGDALAREEDSRPPFELSRSQSRGLTPARNGG